MENFKIEAGWVERVEITQVQTGYVMNITMFDPLNGMARYDTPHGSMYNTEEARFWTDRRCLNEFGYYYVALFLAGNYVRYYPDRWLRDVERSTPLAMAIEELCAVAEWRVPWLTFSELRRIMLVPAP